MDVLFFNLGWMAFNIFLAIIPIVFGFLMLKSRSHLIKIGSGIIWFFFLPNTLYLLTDIVNFPNDARKLTGFYLTLDLSLYIALMIIGVITFILAIDPFERMLFSKKSRAKIRDNMPIIYVLNFLVGFGIVLGRVHRASSWEVFTNTEKVIRSSLETVRSLELMVLVIIFGIMCQIIYHAFGKIIVRSFNLK